ncbi:MAG: hypothetical protein WAM27_11585 [Nitrososphaeraceae archaeon]
MYTTTGHSRYPATSTPATTTRSYPNPNDQLKKSKLKELCKMVNACS